METPLVVPKKLNSDTTFAIQWHLTLIQCTCSKMELKCCAATEIRWNKIQDIRPFAVVSPNCLSQLARLKTAERSWRQIIYLARVPVFLSAEIWAQNYFHQDLHCSIVSGRCCWRHAAEWWRHFTRRHQHSGWPGQWRHWRRFRSMMFDICCHICIT